VLYNKHLPLHRGIQEQCADASVLFFGAELILFMALDKYIIKIIAEIAA